MLNIYIYTVNSTANVVKSSFVGEDYETIDSDGEEDLENVWVTSHGKFHFALESLPQHLQFMHQLLKV